MTSLDEGLTICSVSFGHARHLEFNQNVVRRLNPAGFERITWLVAENAPPGAAHRVASETGSFETLPGSAETSRGASYHHAVALNALLRHARTRFVLVLDPDFFILLPGWISRVESHMRDRGLAFFGAPWHPRYVENYRYFPAVHCMFVDRQRLPADALDFRPRIDAPDAAPAHNRASTLWSRFTLAHRRKQPWDTGSRIHEQFGASRVIRSECVLPVFRVESQSSAGDIHRSARARFLQRVLPDSMCYLPKRRDSYTELGFRERNWIDESLPELWEELVWRDAPFGLHLRGSYAGSGRDRTAELELCRRIVDGHLLHAPVRS